MSHWPMSPEKTSVRDFAPFPHGQLDHGRAEDVARVEEADRSRSAEVEGLIVGDLLDERHGGLDVLRGVERDDRVVHGPPLLGVAPPLEGRVLFLDVRGVHERDGQDVGRGGRRQDRSGEALGDETGNEAAVVQVGMGEEKEIDVLGRDGKGVPVAAEQRPLLIEPAVDEDAEAVGLDEVRRPRDLSGGPQECQLHDASLPTYRE